MSESNSSYTSSTTPRSRELFAEKHSAICCQTDYLFAGLLVFQYIAGILASILISPYTWVGTSSSVHVHVWAAVLLGAVIISFPLYLVWRQPGAVVTRHAIAAAQMLFSALLIHLSGGRIETHFHVFGSLAFLAFYRDWKVLITATVVVAADHFVRGIFWPESVFGVISASPFRALEHAGWVVFEDIFLIRACVLGLRELRALTARQAQLEATNERVEEQVRERTRELESSQAELRHSESRNRSIVETAADGIMTIDGSGVVQSFNPAAERLFGYSSDEVAGLDVQSLMPSSEGGPFWQLSSKVRNAEPTEGGGELIGRRQDGTQFPVELTVSEVESRAGGLFTVIVRDISDRVAAERLLHTQAAELADRNAELLRLKDEADQANVAKSQFLANMSHELRTPMNAIIGYSEMLEEDLTDLQQDALVEDVNKIHAAGQHLLALVNDVLDLSKIEAGKAEMFVEAFDLEILLDEVQATVKPLMERKHNRLVVDRSNRLGQISSDQMKLRQCLLNLLSNAAKFTEDGEIHLTAERTERESASWIDVSVRDSGIGMTPDQLDRVFEAFTQAEGSTTRKYGGTGLGLTITKKFCSMLGGSLEVESEAGVGTTFRISIPADLQPQRPTDPVDLAAVKASVPDMPVAERQRVMVVDDDPVMRDLMTRFLKREGYAAVVVSDSRQALEVARTHRPMAVTLDVMMPEIDGWSVLKQLKNDPLTAEIPVIMISMVDQSDLAYAIGVTDYLRKPVERDRLSRILQQLDGSIADSRILIVDDEPDNRHMLAKMVSKTGCVVMQASDGLEALQCIEDRLPDLVLLDLMMPTMDGFQFLHELKKREQDATIPVIVVSAKELTQQERDELAAEVESVRQKGRFSRAELISDIERCLQPSTE